MIRRLVQRFKLQPGITCVLRRRYTQEPMTSQKSLLAILDDNSTDRYTIEYDGFLSNHISHALIALNHLGASPSRLDRFVTWYQTRLEQPTQDEKTEIVDPELIPSLRGKEVSFYAILRHYKELLDTKYESLDNLIAEEFPKVSAGMAGAAFHGAIQLGYGYNVQHEGTVLEGLAYLHSAYRPVTSTRGDTWVSDIGQGHMDILDVLDSIRNDNVLRTDMLAGEKLDPRNGKATGTFQKRTDFLLTQRGDALIDYAKRIKLPETVYDNGTLDPIKLSKQILEWIITVYAISEVQNDFFLLHGITCTWAMCQILPVLRSDDGARMLAELIVSIEAVYLGQNSPKLSGVIDTKLTVTPEVWENLVKDTLAEDRDEHVYKCVQVCYEQSKMCGHSKAVFLQAAKSCLNNELHF